MMTAWKWSAARRALAGLPFVAAFAFLFWPTFQWMAARFDRSDSFYSHGWLVPLASAWGLALLIPSAAIHVMANWWSINVVSGFAMVAALWGLVWTLWGWPAVRALRFPLLFLLFMVPLPGVLLVAVSFKMKLAAAAAVTQLLALLGIPASQAGSMIHVPGLSVIVDDTCSGLRSLISLLALATLWTALLPPAAPRWRKGIILAAAVPVALLANIVRILILVLVGVFAGPRAAEGFIHYGSGLVVFGIALAALMLLSAALAGRDVPAARAR